MAFDAYINLGDKAKGTSTDSAHKDGWIDVEDFHHGSEQLLSGGRNNLSSGRGDLSPFKFTHVIDQSAVQMQKICVSGDNVPEIKFEVCQAIQGKQQKIYEIVMNDVKITKAHVSGINNAQGAFAGEGVSGAPRTGEVFHEVHLVPTKISWKVSSYDDKGAKLGNVQASYSQAENVTA